MDSLPSHTISRSLVYILALHSMVFMGVLINIRTQMTTEDESAFEINGNGVFFIVAVVALLAAEVTSVILFWTKTNILSDYYAILKCIGIFSATIAPYSLMMVMETPFEQNSLLYLLCYVIYGIIMAYFLSGNDDYDKTLNKSSYISVFTHLGLVLVPLAIVLVLFVPKNLNWLVNSLMYPTFGMEAICFFAIHFKVMIFDDKQNFREIQQDKNNKGQ